MTFNRKYRGQHRAVVAARRRQKAFQRKKIRESKRWFVCLRRPRAERRRWAVHKKNRPHARRLSL